MAHRIGLGFTVLTASGDVYRYIRRQRGHNVGHQTSALLYCPPLHLRKADWIEFVGDH